MSSNKLFSVINDGYSGWLAELTFLSTSGVSGNNDYSVRIIADGKSIYNDSWANFSTYYHLFMSDVSCFDNGAGSFYVLTFNDVPFDKKLKVEVYDVGTTVSFDYIFAKLYQRIGAENIVPSR